MDEKVIDERIKIFKDKIIKLLKSKLRNFNELNDLTSGGVYAVYKDEEVIYVGKAVKQSLKSRIGNLKGDFKAHTLNFKIYSEFLVKENGESFKSNTKKAIEKLSPEKRRNIQDKVNKYINDNFKIKALFLTDKKEIDSFEHFAISVLLPRYND